MDDRTDDGAVASISTVRLYGGTVAVVSGLYSALLSTTGAGPTASLMLVLGVVVAAHGLVLFTSYASRLGEASGPLMIGYAVVMLVLQAWLWTQQPGMGDGGMGDGEMDGGGMGGMDGGMAVMSDPGMVAVAVIMLASGLIMTTRGGMDTSDEMNARDGM